MVKLECSKLPLPDTLRREINSLNFYHPIVTEEYIENEDNETTKKRLFLIYFQWILMILVGVLAGLLSSVQIIYLDKIEGIKRQLLQMMIQMNPDNYVYECFYWIFWAALPTVVTSIIVVYFQPNAEGTGIEAIIGFLNGVAIPKFGKLVSIVVKYICILLISVANLPGGCQEPLVHVVTMVGVYLSKIRIPFTSMYPLKNDVTQRDLAAVGCGAGISAAFGTPIGGTLFALELMTYWSPTITFYIFLSSLCAACVNRTVAISYLDMLGTSSFEHLTFFHPLDASITTFSQSEIPIYILMGLGIGFCGALWNYLQIYINAYRRKFVKYKWTKVLEAVLFAIVIRVISFLLLLNRHDDCFPLYNRRKNHTQTLSEICADEQNKVSSLLFESERNVFNAILVLDEGFVGPALLFSFLGIYESSVYQLGLHIPSGILVPTLISGALMGRLMAAVVRIILPGSKSWMHIGKLAYLGAVAHTSGVTHLRFSLGVIMIEAIGDPLFGLPVFLIIFVTNWVVEFINYPIFHLLIKFKGIPVLDPEYMPLVPSLTAEDVMTKEVICLPSITNPKILFDFVQRYDHLGFPVVNSRNIIKAYDGSATKTIGFICRSDIYRILNPDRRQSFSSAAVRKITTVKDGMPDVSFNYLMDPNPLKIRKNTTLSRAYELFVTLGLQHLLVVDNQNYLVGLITRKDLAAIRFEMLFFNARLSRARIEYSKEEEELQA